MFSFLAFAWIGEKGLHEVQTHLIGTYNLDNVLAAAAIGRFFGVEEEEISLALSSYIPQITALNWKKPQIII